MYCGSIGCCAVIDIDPARYTIERTDVRGFTQAYVHENPGGAGPLVLVHGWPESKRIWWKVIAPLAEAGFEVIAPDLRGFGDSDVAPDGFHDVASHSRDVYALVHDHLGHDTALLVVPDRGDLLYVDKVLSDARDVRTDPRVSSRRPLQCSSLGKALLAALDDRAVEEIIERIGLERATEYSIMNRDALMRDLAGTRARGYSVDAQEALLGVWCVGAPVRDHTGRSIAAISLSTIKEFFDADRTGPQVAAAAVAISRAMGWKGDSSSLYDPVPGSELVLLDDRATQRVGSR